MFPKRKSFANKTIQNLSYRPIFEISGILCQMYANGDFETTAPLIVADVGAAQGLDPRWEMFKNKCVQIGYEPDEAECERLRSVYANDDPSSTRKFLEPIALWHSAETRNIKITRDPDASSFYEPNEEFFERFPDPTLQQVVSEVSVSAIPLDQYKLPVEGTIDFIKMDVQAAELDVMVGASQHLEDGVLAVVAEMLFTPHYKEQPWFGDFDTFMRARGYQVFDIDLRRWRRRNLPSQFDGVRVGGVSYGDVLYLKDPLAFHQKDNNPSNDGHQFCKPGDERDKMIKLILLAEFFSLPDYAIEIIEHAGSLGLLSDSEVDVMSESVKMNVITSWNDRNVMPQ